MIKFFRVDERLIHGQIVIKWSRHIDVNRILVANDTAAGNEIIKKTLLMAAPSDVRTAILTVDDAIEILNDPRMATVRVLVLVIDFKDAVRVAKEVEGIPYVNVGNYGRVAPSIKEEPRRSYGNNLYLNDTEVKEIKELLQLVPSIIYQTTPEEPAEDVGKLVVGK